MMLNDFTKALHEDEKELAKKFQDDKGTDWNKYILEKEKAGFCKFEEWQFMDYSHITTQISSKYVSKWGTRMVGVVINDRKVDVQFFVTGSQRAKKDCHYKLYKELHGTQSKRDAENGSESGKKLIQDLVSPFQAVGHGINFSVSIETENEKKPELVKACEGKDAYKPRNMTVIWTNHDNMIVILHEDRHFVDI